MSVANAQPIVPSRRGFLKGTGQSVLSATAVALIVGCESMAANRQSASNPQGDVEILNVALGLEWEAIGAYQIGAESGLLEQSVLAVAAHADALAGAIMTFGGTPVEPRSQSDYARDLDVASVTSGTDVLRLAARLEKGAANAYLGVIPAFSEPDLAQVSGRLAADETMHWTVLASALGDPIPQQALSFGA
jgi:hypothetical protein